MGGALQRMAAQAEKRRGAGEPVEEVDGEEGEVAGTESEAAADVGKVKAKGRKRKQPAAKVEEGVNEEGVNEDGDEDGSEFEAPKRKARKGRGGAKSARGRGK
jgi:hypothetical protein